MKPYFFILITSLIYLVLAVLAGWSSSHYIYTNFPHRPIAPDLLLDKVPYYKWAEYLTDISVTLSGLLFMGYVFVYQRQHLPRILFVLGTFWLLRGGINLLTPLALPSPLSEETYGFNIFFSYGMFPSGHIGFAFLVFLFIKKRYFKLKALAGIAFFIGTIGMILAHGHYSIDLIGGVLLAYMIYNTSHDKKILRFFKQFNLAT